MKYYSYKLLDGSIDTISEDEIQKFYNEYLKSQFADENICFYDFLDFWIVQNQAWESD